MRVCIIPDNTPSSHMRVGSLERLQQQQELKNEYKVAFAPEDCDAAYFVRPSGYNRFQVMTDFAKLGAKIIIDQDDSYEDIPQHHPGWAGVGKGNQEFKWHIESLKMADAITTSTKYLAEKFRKYCQKTFYIPNSWDDTNSYWSSIIPKERNVIGWGGTITHVEDWRESFAYISDAIKGTECKISICGDYRVYDMFKAVPENRKIFWPSLHYNHYIHWLKSIGVMIIPLSNNEFNRGKSDVKKLEAISVYAVPIHSSMPVYNEIQVGYSVSHPYQWKSSVEEWLSCGNKDWSTYDALREQRRSTIIVKQYDEVVSEIGYKPFDNFVPG